MGFKDYLLEAYEKAIKPACRDCGFEALLITDKEHNTRFLKSSMSFTEVKRKIESFFDFAINVIWSINRGRYRYSYDFAVQNYY